MGRKLNVLKTMFIPYGPVVYVKNRIVQYGQLGKGLATEIKRAGQVDPRYANTVEHIVANNINPKLIAKKARSHQNFSQLMFMGGLLIAVYLLLDLFVGKVGLTTSTFLMSSYVVALFMMSLVFQVRAYRLFKLEHTSMLEFLAADDKCFVDKYKFSSKLIIENFKKYGQENYARQFLTKSKNKNKNKEVINNG